MAADTTYLEGCVSCATPAIVGGQRTPEAVQRGVRMNTGSEHALLFCAGCASRPYTADEWADVLAHNLASFEAAWEIKKIPHDIRARHRAEMAHWQILGWAQEVPAPPVAVCDACGTAIPLASAKFCPQCGAPRGA